MTLENALGHLDRLTGKWVTEATHPALPGLLVHGGVDIRWLEGRRFLLQRAKMEHADFPSSISIIGNIERDRLPAADVSDEDGLAMHYFDSRGVFRSYDVSLEDGVWRVWRRAPGFSQRFMATFAPDGDTITGRW